MSDDERKSYSEMTPAERTADRIAKNRKIDDAVSGGKGGLSLDGIVAKLQAAQRRATYGAVAEVAGVLPRGLMTGRAKSARFSWIVAAASGSGARKGWPTGYTVSQIDPACYAQIREGTQNVINTGSELREWLETQSPAPGAPGKSDS